MNDAGAVSLVQRIGDLDRVTERVIQRQRATPKSVCQCFAFEMFHHQESGTVLVTNVMNYAYVRVIQRGSGTCLALEPLSRLRIGSQRRGEDLDRNRSLESGVASAIDLAHAAAAERRLNFERAEANAA